MLGIVVVLLAASTSACSEVQGAAPGCDQARRLGVVAQAVPSAAYVPCLNALRAGWSAQDFEPRSGRVRFALVSDRDPEHAVTVELTEACDQSGTTPTTPRADGTKTLLRLRSITPRYAGTLLDVFTGGCISYSFDFARGPHIGLIDDLENEVGLLARRDLARELRTTYGMELGA